ncbi:unnamed protein product, partial [Choristocarpus tenellus]
MATVAELSRNVGNLMVQSERVGDGDHPVVQAAVPSTRPPAGGVPVEVGPMEPIEGKQFGCWEYQKWSKPEVRFFGGLGDRRTYCSPYDKEIENPTT